MYIYIYISFCCIRGVNCGLFSHHGSRNPRFKRLRVLWQQIFEWLNTSGSYNYFTCPRTFHLFLILSFFMLVYSQACSILTRTFSVYHDIVAFMYELYPSPCTHVLLNNLSYVFTASPDLFLPITFSVHNGIAAFMYELHLWLLIHVFFKSFYHACLLPILFYSYPERFQLIFLCMIYIHGCVYTCFFFFFFYHFAYSFTAIPLTNSKVHGASMGPVWGRQDPGGPHVGPRHFAIWVLIYAYPELFSFWWYCCFYVLYVFMTVYTPIL